MFLCPPTHSLQTLVQCRGVRMVPITAYCHHLQQLPAFLLITFKHRGCQLGRAHLPRGAKRTTLTAWVCYNGILASGRLKVMLVAFEASPLSKWSDRLLLFARHLSRLSISVRYCHLPQWLIVPCHGVRSGPSIWEYSHCATKSVAEKLSWYRSGLDRC